MNHVFFILAEKSFQAKVRFQFFWSFSVVADEIEKMEMKLCTCVFWEKNAKMRLYRAIVSVWDIYI